ncbi:FAD-dependent monooxygenase [Burkholderia sp. LMG 32019]|uniref:FAD binding domain-containing protein n=1 Tax=Burkholderia sp. LMG 32019 TaxID=3158173 RepID=UPI003C2AEF99
MKIAIAGGSITGLAAAVTLNCIGHEVVVHERRDRRVPDHGGGVAVLRRMTAFLDAHGGQRLSIATVPTRRRRWIDRAGGIVDDACQWLPFSSWDIVYRALCAMLPDGMIRYGSPVTVEHRDPDGVDLQIGATRERVDLLVAAEGAGSRIRTALFPGYAPRYAGYFAWRGVVDEAAFDAETIEMLVENLTLYRQPGELFMAFQIPAADGMPGPRAQRFNWIWYRSEANLDTLRDHLADLGGRLHDASAEPGLLSTRAHAALGALARERLPPVLSQLVEATAAPSVQAVFDVFSPAFANGRIALVGDAACTLRPHTASGMSKALADAVTLAQALPSCAHDVTRRTASWAAARRVASAGLADAGVRFATDLGLGACA